MARTQWSQDDQAWMSRALLLAQRSVGRVEPNPAVGAVLVRNGKLIGAGYHRYFGGPHAEVEAITQARRAGRKVKNSTIYVTLEPCCHFGKTPPCTQALIEAGIAQVVIAARDPSEKVAGKGIAALRKAGITVRCGLMAKEAELLNGWFFKFHRQNRPWVICKWAQTLDGKLAARTSHSQWISGPKSRLEAHRLRQTCQAVVAGIGTVRADDPQLTVRLDEKKHRFPRVPNRVVLDARLCISLNSCLIRTAKEIPTWVFTSHRNKASKVSALENRGVRVIGLTDDGTGRLSLDEFLDFAAQQGWTRVMVEGGPKLLSSFLAKGLADELVIFQSSTLAMDDHAYQLSGQKPSFASDFLSKLQFDRVSMAGSDVVMRLLLK